MDGPASPELALDVCARKREAARGDTEADLGCDAAVSESWFLRSYAPNSPVASSPAAPLPRPALPTSLLIITHQLNYDYGSYLIKQI